jgi:hypothetical protein
MSLAFRIAQLVADGFLVGFVLWWLWRRRFGRSLRRSCPSGAQDPARAGNGSPDLCGKSTKGDL